MKLLFFFYVIIGLFYFSTTSPTVSHEDTSEQPLDTLTTTTKTLSTESTGNIITDANSKHVKEIRLPRGRNLPFEHHAFQAIPIPPNSVIGKPPQFQPLDEEALLMGNNPELLNYDFDEDLEEGPDGIYPPHGGDLAAAETGLVFRPLFAYRKMTAKRKRLYGNKQTYPTKTGQRRRVSHNIGYYPGYSGYGYYYREPSYNYHPYYPSWYANAQWEHVA